MKRRTLLGAALLGMGVPVAAQPQREVKIGMASGSMAVAAGRIANELGLFGEHGLAPRFVAMDSSTAAITALISGSVDLIISGVPELIVAQSRDQPVVAICNTYSGFATSLVLAKSVADRIGVPPAAPVRDRLRALDGLIVASTSATAIGTVAFRSALHDVGAAVRFTYIAQQAMPAALDSRAVQAFTSSAPYWAIPVATGSGVLWISGPKGEFPPEYTPQTTAQLQTMRTFAQANPDLMHQLAAVFAELSGSIESRPDDVKAAVLRLYPNLDTPTLEVLFASEALGWRARPLTVDAMALEIGLANASGIPMQSSGRLDPAMMVWRDR